MRTNTIRSLSIAAFAFVAFTASAAAEQADTALLNLVDVPQLVSRGEPGDHARLAAHFTALGRQYAAEAGRHTSMSKSYVVNASRNLGAGMAVHCLRLAELNDQSAATLAELARHHQKLATGASSALPADGARFEGGVGAREPSPQDLSVLAAKASTAADHLALTEYFVTVGKRHASRAREHTALAQAYRGTRLAQVAVLQDRLAELSRDSAKEANEAAAMHRQLAGLPR